MVGNREPDFEGEPCRNPVVAQCRQEAFACVLHATRRQREVSVLVFLTISPAADSARELPDLPGGLGSRDGDHRYARADYVPRPQKYRVLGQLRFSELDGVHNDLF